MAQPALTEMIRALTNKIRVTDLALAHTDTLRVEYRDEHGDLRDRRSWGDLVLFFVVPVLAGVATWWFGVKAPDADPLLAAVAVLTGLLFALIVLVFDRLVLEREKPAPTAGNDPVVDTWQLLANVSWAILASLVLLVVLFTATLFVKTDLPPWLTALVAGLGLHLILTLLMVLKRVFLMAKRIAGYRRLPEYRR